MGLGAIFPPASARAGAGAVFALALATIAGAWIFEAMGFPPCELCSTQRIAYYVGVPLSALIAIGAPQAQKVARLALIALALVFAANSVLAAYHVGVEYHWWKGPTACTGSMSGPTDVNDLLKQLDAIKVVACDEVQLRIAGLSLAGWNVLISAALAIYAALASRAKA